jgi:hypothetical protein
MDRKAPPPLRPPYRKLTVKLPTFMILALHEMVKDANERQHHASPWAVDLLLERFLTAAITTKQLETYARRSPNFKRATEAWLRWSAQYLRRK